MRCFRRGAASPLLTDVPCATVLSRCSWCGVSARLLPLWSDAVGVLEHGRHVRLGVLFADDAEMEELVDALKVTVIPTLLVRCTSARGAVHAWMRCTSPCVRVRACVCARSRWGTVRRRMLRLAITKVRCTIDVDGLQPCALSTCIRAPVSVL